MGKTPENAREPSRAPYFHLSLALDGAVEPPALVVTIGAPDRSAPVRTYKVLHGSRLTADQVADLNNEIAIAVTEATIRFVGVQGVLHEPAP